MLSAFFGVLSLVSLLAALYQSFLAGGTEFVKYGVVGLLCLIFAATGLVLGILAKKEEDKFYLFAWMGIVLNLLTVLGVGIILYIGVYGA